VRRLPRDPWVKWIALSIVVEQVASDGDSANPLNSSNTHKSEIIARSQIGVAGEVLVESGATLVEGDDAADTVYGGDKTDEDRWRTRT